MNPFTSLFYLATIQQPFQRSIVPETLQEVMCLMIFLLSNILSAMQIEYCQKSSRASKKSRWTLKDEYVNILSASRPLYFLRVIPTLTQYSDIVSDTPSGNIYDIYTYIFSDILSGTCIWHIFWHSFWHSIWYIFGYFSWLRSGG